MLGKHIILFKACFILQTLDKTNDSPLVFLSSILQQIMISNY